MESAKVSRVAWWIASAALIISLAGFCDSMAYRYSSFMLPACNAGKVIPPTPSQWVTDWSNRGKGLISAETRAALDAKLKAYQESSGHHVLVWIADSTDGEPPEEFCPRVFNAWGIGRYAKDDGVVLFVFTKDDVRWITVGYGFESAITDKEAAQICREVIAPEMHAGHNDRAIINGVEAILGEIEGWEKR